ncbi:sarcosine oxidase subunit gamma, partial [Amaricoccus solimangrovi]
MNVMTPARATRPVAVTRLEPSARFVLRLGDPGAAAIALGLALPSRIGARAVSGARTALCLGPDEWLVEAPEGERDALTQAFAEIATHLPLSAVEVSDREITLALEGPAVLDLIATGCPRDLAGMAIGTGARTIFDTVQIVLTREADDRFHLTVWRSFLPH